LLPGRMLISVSVLVLLMGSAGVSAVSAGDRPASNRVVMSDLAAEIAKEVSDKVAVKVDGYGLELSAHLNDENHSFLGNVMVAVMTENGYKLFQSPSTSPDGTRLVLKYRLLNFTLAYPDVYRSWLIGGKRIKRRANLTVATTLVDPRDGSVLWVGESSREYNDEFDNSDRGLVEEGNFSFTKPAVPSGGWGKYVEPVFVSGIVVGLVYLFFSNQDSAEK